MAKGYTLREIVEMLDEAANDPATFYKRPFINYRGTPTDAEMLYSEIIAKWLLEHGEMFERISRITREKSYRADGHSAYAVNPESNRTEELIAMDMKRQRHVPGIGEIIDYQTPLNNRRSDHAGKIDVLAYDASENVLRILELKKPKSEETMLRCVLEGYTYLKTVNQEKLKRDYSECGVPEDAEVRAFPLVFTTGVQAQEMREGRPRLQELMEHLNVRPLYVSYDGGAYAATDEAS